MAIRDVVTRGYGNGTFSPGVNKVPTRGFSIAAVVVVPLDAFTGWTTGRRLGGWAVPVRSAGWLTGHRQPGWITPTR